MRLPEVIVDQNPGGDANPVQLHFHTPPGLSETVVRQISAYKNEPAWVLRKRLEGLAYFHARPVPTWGPDLSDLNLDAITYFADPGHKETQSWANVAPDIRATFERLGIPQAEINILAGAGAQYEATMAYHHLKETWSAQGVIFENFDTAVQRYPDLVASYFMTRCVPINDHTFAALHAAVFSGGTFIYIPPGVHVTAPLQAYFRMNAPGTGQFEHTLIIADEGSFVHYIEGCSAPQYTVNNLHAGCVEIFVKAGARVRYTSIENWSKNTYNLNTKRALVEADGIMEWVNGNLGCLTGDTKIFTNPTGPKKIEDINPGDKIYAWDKTTNTLKKTRVKAKVFSGNKQIYELRAGGRIIEATGNHPFLSLSHKKNEENHKKGFFHFVWKPLEALHPGDFVALAKTVPIEGQPYTLPSIKNGEMITSHNQYKNFNMNTAHLFNNYIKIPTQTSEGFMWLMGILIGDGHVDNRHNKINIATHEKEDYRNGLCNLIQQLFHYQITEKKDRYIIINSKQLCALFTQIGINGTADTKRVPSWVFSLPREQILSFIAGYFDADGHPQDGAIAFTSINKELLNDIKLLGISVGFGVSQIMKHGTEGKMIICGIECNAQNSWRLLFNGKEIYNLPVQSKKKKQKINKIKTKRNYGAGKGKNFRSKTNNEIGFARITSIKPISVKPTWDIEVEEFHNFIANGLIVHNSRVTMLYPCSILKGTGARTEFLGITYAGAGQHQDTGSKAVHLAAHTRSTIVSKSIVRGGGRTTYRGLLKVNPGAHHVKSSVTCDALILDDQSRSHTIPYMDVRCDSVDIGHEARVGRISADQLFYVQSRGLTAAAATQLIVLGFIEPIVKALPLEYAVEFNRLIELEMEGSVG